MENQSFIQKFNSFDYSSIRIYSFIQACTNLLDASKKLHEQSKLVQEAIMTAVLEKMTTATDIYVSVKETLIEKATNFNCTDVLSEKVSYYFKHF